ncbi:MAG: cyclase family protein [Bacteroidia bacterium]|nr:cyclase family protein [Bacteroidia bacterium]
MKSIIEIQDSKFEIDFSSPLDISIPLVEEQQPHVNAFYLPPTNFEIAKGGDFVGSVAEGGSCNVKNIFFSPHGNGTHTECIGHITKEKYTVNDCLKDYFFTAILVNISPDKLNDDYLITAEQIRKAVGINKPESLIIRTMPNDESKKNKNYSGSNPAYVHHEAASLICSIGIKHLLIDLPSMDKEDDGGKLLAHHAFWNYPASPRINSTITELVYVPDEIKDGWYFLNLQVAAFECDASPSRPVLFRMNKK